MANDKNSGMSAGGTTLGSASGASTSQQGASFGGESSSGFEAQGSGGFQAQAQHSGGLASQSFGSQQGDQPGSSGAYASYASYSEDRSRRDSVMEMARDHKTGIAVGVAVGAIAAAAIPFMLRGRSGGQRSRSQSESYPLASSGDFSASASQASGTSDIHVDNRGGTTGVGGRTRY